MRKPIPVTTKLEHQRDSSLWLATRKSYAGFWSKNYKKTTEERGKQSKEIQLSISWVKSQCTFNVNDFGRGAALDGTHTGHRKKMEQKWNTRWEAISVLSPSSICCRLQGSLFHFKLLVICYVMMNNLVKPLGMSFDFFCLGNHTSRVPTSL